MRRKRSYAKDAVSIILYIINIISLFYPWIIIGDKRYNFVQLRNRIKETGIGELIHQNGLDVDNPEFVWFSIKALFVIYYIFIVLSVSYILTVLFQVNWRLNKVAFYGAIAIAILNASGYSIASLCTDRIMGMCFPLISVAITLIELVISEAIEHKEHKK